MSQLLINNVSLISRLCGCLVYSKPEKIYLLSRILYTVNVLQSLGNAVSFLYYILTGKTLIANFYHKQSIVLEVFNLDSRVIVTIEYLITCLCQSMTIIGSWNQRKLISKVMADAKIVLEVHGQAKDSRWKNYRQLFIYPILLILRFVLIAAIGSFETKDPFLSVFIRFFTAWSQMASICMEGQFAAVASIVETGLMDINQRIEDFAKKEEEEEEEEKEEEEKKRKKKKEETGNDYRADCHLGYNCQHPFFQYREIIPSLPINIRSSLINFELNKRSPNQGTARAAFEQYSDSMGGLNCQLLPPREEIRNRRDAEVFDPFLANPGAPGAPGVLGTFKAIEEEKQPARNQFATKSNSGPFHQPRISGKISPPKKKLGERKSSRIRIGSKGWNRDVEGFESPRIREENKGWQMEELTKQHSRVVRLAADLSKSFRSQLAGIQLFVRVNCPLDLYLMLRHLKLNSRSSDGGKKSWMNNPAWIIPVVIGHQLTRAFIPCERGHSAILQGDKTRRRLLALSRGRLSTRLCHEVEVLLNQVELYPIEFKAGLNTRVDRAQFFSILLSILGSLIILTQLLELP